MIKKFVIGMHNDQYLKLPYFKWQATMKYILKLKIIVLDLRVDSVSGYTPRSSNVRSPDQFLLADKEKLYLLQDEWAELGG